MSDEMLIRQVRDLEIDNARLRRLLAKQGTPSGLRHQVRNTLTTVREFIRRSAETSDSVEDYAAHLEGRLDAVLRVQNAIASGPSEDGVSLHALVADELLSYGIGEGGRAIVAGPGLVLGPAAAGAFALALHELATNAVKFGAMTVPDGLINVSWSVAPGSDGEPRLTWVWIESGLSGLAPTPPRRGFGLEIIEHALSYQLNAVTALLFTPTGLHCTIGFPLTSWVGSLRTSVEAASPEVQQGQG